MIIDVNKSISILPFWNVANYNSAFFAKDLYII